MARFWRLVPNNGLNRRNHISPCSAMAFIEQWCSQFYTISTRSKAADTPFSQYLLKTFWAKRCAVIHEDFSHWFYFPKNLTQFLCNYDCRFCSTFPPTKTTVNYWESAKLVQFVLIFSSILQPQVARRTNYTGKNKTMTCFFFKKKNNYWSWSILVLIQESVSK